MPVELFIASHNPGKIREFQAVLASSDLSLFSSVDRAILAEKKIVLPANFSVEETGQTLKANALLKAKAFAEQVSLPTIADDSGLELAAKPGFPGVHSDRWFQGTATERNLALLDLVKNLSSRAARFSTVICLHLPQSNKSYFFVGELQGKIATEIRGDEEAGFGYDPIFIPKGYQQTFAELGLAVKNRISHRAKALAKLRAFLQTAQAREILCSK